MIGADGINDLVHWHGIAELIDACNITVMHRAGCEKPDFTKFENIWGRQRIEKLQRNIITTPSIDIISTKIRNQIALGKDVTNMLHPSVAEYIVKHGLYK